MSRMYMLAVVVVAAVLSGGCKKEKEPEKVVVQMEKVGTDNLEIYGEYVGRIRARRFVEVRARVEGYLEKMLFEEGKRVQQNQPLFMINRAQYKARADKADAQLKKDLAQEAKAARDVERLRPLYEQKAASQLDLDNAVAAYESAKASVAMSRADLAQANLELGYTTVKSPVSGYISERYVDIGTLVGPGAKSLLATIVDSDTVSKEQLVNRMLSMAGLSEKFAAECEVGRKRHVAFLAAEYHRYPGRQLHLPHPGIG